MPLSLSFRLSTSGAVIMLGLSIFTSVNAAPSLFSVEDNVAYAVSAICAPYALDKTDRVNLPIHQGLVQPDGHDGLARPNPTGVRVGAAGFVHVTFSERPDGTRSCDIIAKGADPQALRKAALDALAKRAEQFVPTKSNTIRDDLRRRTCFVPPQTAPTRRHLSSYPHRA